jgi:hypothetical protein
MLRMYCLQHGTTCPIPERHDLTKAVFGVVAEHLEVCGALLRGGTIVDATLIVASP